MYSGGRAYILKEICDSNEGSYTGGGVYSREIILGVSWYVNIKIMQSLGGYDFTVFGIWQFFGRETVILVNFTLYLVNKPCHWDKYP